MYYILFNLTCNEYQMTPKGSVSSTQQCPKTNCKALDIIKVYPAKSVVWIVKGKQSSRYSCCCHKTNGGQKKAQASHRRPCATDTVTNLSFIFETWRADFRSSYRKTQEQRHRPWNPGDVYVLSQEGVKNTKTERRIKEKKEAS